MPALFAMNKLEKTKMADTITLCELADDARERGLNRQFDQHLIDTLDPQGIHILFFAMPHEHRAGEEYDLHFRTMWMVKVKDKREPLKVHLDIMPEQFNSLPEDWQVTEEED